MTSNEKKDDDTNFAVAQPVLLSSPTEKGGKESNLVELKLTLDEAQLSRVLLGLKETAEGEQVRKEQEQRKRRYGLKVFGILFGLWLMVTLFRMHRFYNHQYHRGRHSHRNHHHHPYHSYNPYYHLDDDHQVKSADNEVVVNMRPPHQIPHHHYGPIPPHHGAPDHDHSPHSYYHPEHYFRKPNKDHDDGNDEYESLNGVLSRPKHHSKKPNKDHYEDEVEVPNRRPSHVFASDEDSGRRSKSWMRPIHGSRHKQKRSEIGENAVNVDILVDEITTQSSPPLPPSRPSLLGATKTFLNFLYPGPRCKVDYSPMDLSGMFDDHRSRILAQYSSVKPGDIIFLFGNKQEERTNSDTDILFRQDSSFLYLTGYNVPDSYFALDMATGFSAIFVRRKSRSELIFDGGYDDFDAIARDTQVDYVFYDDEVVEILEEIFKVKKIYTQDESNLLSEFPALSQYEIDDNTLMMKIATARWIKSEWEVALMQYSADVSAMGHMEMMKAVTPGMYESDLESVFLFESYNCDLRFQSYISIVGAGKNGAILHYIANDAEIKDGDIILIDAASEYLGYGCDITRTFPANGRYTTEQTEVYNIVLKAQMDAIELLVPGSYWTDITNRADRSLVEGMVQYGFLVGDVDDILRSGVLGTFYPHGLGHPVGLDVHDPYPSGPFKENMLYTIEPGIYFIEMLLDEAKQDETLSQYINWDKVDQFRDFGGVRIEDIILVTASGNEVITSSVPKDIASIEAIISGEMNNHK